MKSALLLTAIAATLCVASPALACRIPSPVVMAEARMPVVGFTAVVASNERAPNARGEDIVTLTLDLRHPIVGPVENRTTVSAFASDEIVVSTCGPIRPYGWELMNIPTGTEVAVSAIGADDHSLIIRIVAPVDSDRGRTLLADFERLAAAR